MEITKRYPEAIAVLQAALNLKLQADKLKKLVLAKKGKRDK
jgi:xanthine dehydrogenase iron-sulfur cluster and FAD-binding subunit A